MHASLRNKLATTLHTYTADRSTPSTPTTTTMESRDQGRGGLKKLPSSWTPGHNFSLAGGCFPWPLQRSSLPSSSSSYTCGYCRREFRSAQALGGHMNVHRRDRARLRQCCPAAWPSSSPLPSSTNLQAAAPQQHRAPLPNLNHSPPHCAGGLTAEAPVIYSFFSTATSTVVAAATKPTATLEVSLELGIGVCGGGGCSGEGLAEEGLDLELRLGCAWE